MMSRKGPATDGLKTRLKTARGRTVASQKWLERQLNDPYVKAAKAKGYRSRAAFKLIEVDQKHRLLKRGAIVIDLGAAPGGWAQVAADKVGPQGKVIGIDILEMDPIPGVTLECLDFMAEEAPDRLRALAGGLVDVVLSDMAPNTTGHRETDHLRIMALCEAALAFAIEILRPGGAFLCKVRQGGTEKTLLDLLKRHFAKVVHIKPPASRADSTEMYVLGTGFRAG
ncbi:MAG TPA: rRNA methyltransferase [Alphaproteobacteria bacterium]|nr:rRNA methyltransferase [Alphaproteobacteria bacterium]